MDIQQLEAELKSHIGENPSDVFAALTKPTRTKVISRICTELTILAAFPTSADGDACLAKLETAGNSNPYLRRAVGWLKPGAPGLDIGHPFVRAAIQKMATNILSATEAATLLGLSEVSISRAQEINCGDLTVKNVAYHLDLLAKQ